MSNVKLDNLDLIKREDDSQKAVVKEIRSVYNVNISNRRKVVEHKLPGTYGSILQDLGRDPVRISFEGYLFGDTAKDRLQDIWSKFMKGEPMPFASDLTGMTDVTKVLIEDLRTEDVGGNPNKYHYFITLSEYTEPPPKAKPAPSQTQQAQKQVQKESDVHDVEGQILDADGNPAKGINVKISSPDGERQVTTDDQGYYKILDVPEGKYEMTVDEEGYENQKAEVEVKKKAGGEEGEEEEGGGGEGGESGEEEGGAEEGSEGESEE